MVPDQARLQRILKADGDTSETARGGASRRRTPEQEDPRAAPRSVAREPVGGERSGSGSVAVAVASESSSPVVPGGPLSSVEGEECGHRASRRAEPTPSSALPGRPADGADSEVVETAAPSV